MDQGYEIEQAMQQRLQRIESAQSKLATINRVVDALPLVHNIMSDMTSVMQGWIELAQYEVAVSATLVKEIHKLDAEVRKLEQRTQNAQQTIQQFAGRLERLIDHILSQPDPETEIALKARDQIVQMVIAMITHMSYLSVKAMEE